MCFSKIPGFRPWLGTEKNMWRGLWKINFPFLQHLSPEYLKALYTKNYATLALLNPRGICSMEWSGDLPQVVTGGFLTWPKLRKAVSLLLCPSLPITSLLLPPSLTKSAMPAPWAADPLLLPLAPSFLHTFLASHYPAHFGKCSPDPKEFTG